MRGGDLCHVKGGWWIAEGLDGAGGKQDGHCAVLGVLQVSAIRTIQSFMRIWMRVLSG